MNTELTKTYAKKFSTLLQSRLIWYKHYFLWCDEIIEKSEKPPYWIIELSTTKFRGDAIRIVNEYANSEPFEEYKETSLSDLYIACLYIRYERGEISWATFLHEAGTHADCSFGCKIACEYFFDMLNNFEDNEYLQGLEKSQEKEVLMKFNDEIKEVDIYYSVFKQYFKKYVNKEID